MNPVAPPKPPADFDDWRERLLVSLRDCDVQRAPRFAALRYIVAILAFGVSIILASIISAVMNRELRNAPPGMYLIAYGIYFIFFAAVVARIRNYFLRRAWQSSAASAEDEITRLGSRRPILYLRSFNLDQKVGRRSWLEIYLGTRPFPTAEQRFTKELRKLGPVIGIGRPGEKLPPLGAARFYVSHERWQEKVMDVVRCAQGVVWATGVTEGLRWEISHLVENIHPRRLILWAHPHLLRVSAAKREAEWAKFRESLGTVFPKPLPEKLGDARFFVFDQDWNPQGVVPDLAAVFTDPQKSALRKTLRLQQNGLDDPVANRPRIMARSESVHDFGALIGARGPRINWYLMGLFFAAVFLTPLVKSYIDRIILSLTDYQVSSWGAAGMLGKLFGNALNVAALVLAFRCIRHSALAVLAAAAGMSIVSWPFSGNLVSSFLTNLLLIGSLTWAVGRCSPLFIALWFGYFLGKIADVGMSWILSLFRAPKAPLFLIERSLGALIEAVLFAVIYVIAIKLMSWALRRFFPDQAEQFRNE